MTLAPNGPMLYMHQKYNRYWFAGGKCYRAISIAGIWRLCIEDGPDRWRYVNKIEYQTPSEAFEEAETLKRLATA